MKDKKLIIIIGLIILLVIPNNYVMATLNGGESRFTAIDKINNSFLVGDVDIEVKENFESPENWEGNTHRKEVLIENLSKSEALIRVNITARWADENGNPVALDASNKVVKLNYVNVYTNGDENKGDNPGWILGADGYYYYNKIVKTGDSTVAILNSVEVVITDFVEKENYKGNKLIVDVKSEAVQGTKDGYNAAWANISDLNIRDMLDKLCIR